MKRNYYRTGNYRTDYSTCGSAIYNYDFEGYATFVFNNKNSCFRQFS